jgi:hypothetical protein
MTIRVATARGGSSGWQRSRARIRKRMVSNLEIRLSFLPNRSSINRHILRRPLFRLLYRVYCDSRTEFL